VDLICVGDVMLDVRAASGELAQGGDVHGRVLIRPGGTSANAAVWAAHDGASSSVVAGVGDDLAGELAVRALRDRGVDTGWIRHRPAPTGVMLVVTEAGERSMVADRGANASLTPEDLPTLEAGAVLISGYLLLQQPGTEVAQEAFGRARTSLLAIETASWPLLQAFGPDRFFAETEGCAVLLANEDEARILSDRDGPEAARALGERYRIVAVKRGSAGAALCVDGGLLQVSAEPVVEVDPTGAGDAFDGVLLGALARGTEPGEALERACAAGSAVATTRETWPEETAL
jgi:sugar/nucleoside kinase (ribokinase family)